MTRMRGRARPTDSERALACAKYLPITATALLTQAAEVDGYGGGARRSAWAIEVVVRGDVLKAWLTSKGTVLTKLDHHYRGSQAPNGAHIAPGYHWDVFVPYSAKEYVEPQPGSPAEALAILCVRWQITLDTDLQETFP
jgi:hypothetical protein